VITDATGRVEEVRGPGVVGEQPILSPGQSFSYTSGCPLRTRRGTMAGEFSCVALKPDGEWGEAVEVIVGKFGLDADGETMA